VAIPDDLRALLTAAGPSGHEEPASRVWREAAAAFAEVTSDTLGTSFARVGVGSGATLALVGHIDEIGLIVTHIDGAGLLAFRTLGGIDADILAGQRVTFAGGAGPVEGVVVPRARERGEGGDGRLRLAELHVDIGAAGADDAAARVAPGDAGVWHGAPLELPNGRVVSRALDNRLGAYTVLEAARRLAAAGDVAVDAVAVAAVQEESGGSGARAAAFALAPDVALVVDVTWATDVPGADARRAGSVELGSGAAITRGPVVNPHVAALLASAADEEGIAHTFEVYAGPTRSDADAVYAARAGIPTGLVSIPLRYMHSPCELCALDDLEAAVRLLVAFARRLGPETSFLR
jgi:endoglucanase